MRHRVGELVRSRILRCFLKMDYLLDDRIFRKRDEEHQTTPVPPTVQLTVLCTFYSSFTLDFICFS